MREAVHVLSEQASAYVIILFKKFIAKMPIRLNFSREDVQSVNLSIYYASKKCFTGKEFDQNKLFCYENNILARPVLDKLI